MTVELVELEPLPGRRVAIDAELTIGRQGCDLTVSSPQVSRRHARVAPSGDAAEIADLGSRNGTFVNDSRIGESQPLRAGDTVRIGETIWEVATAQTAASGSEARGDVPAPPPPTRAPVPAAPAGPAPAAAAGPAAASLDAETHPRPSAARRVEATLICYAVVLLTAIGVVGYLATR